MGTLTLVTAYFNIHRDHWGTFSRSDEKYLSYFSHWARLRNPLVVYTSPHMTEKVMNIRKSFQLADQTTVIPIKEDVRTLQPELYHAIKQAMQNKVSWLFHKKLNHPESWNYDYNYLTGIKPFWVQDAISRKLTNGFSAWIDFGYDHGGDDFPVSSDFDFLWQPALDPLIHFALENPMDDLPIFEVVRSMKVYVRGNLIMAPDALWPGFWQDSKAAILTLAECGLADDDQTIELMAYRRHPERFKTHVTAYWGELLHLYSEAQLSPKPSKSHQPDSLNKRFKHFIQKQKERIDIHHRHGTEIEKNFFKQQ